MENRYNVVVLGKTGVGKSTFINYLYGKNKMKTGVGRPVTNVGFHHIDFNLKELPVRLFDTWGLEAGKSKMWLKELKKELSKRSTSHSADSWFHTVFYCISSGGQRVEPFEVDVIKNFIQEKYAVTIVLTKADQATQKELDTLELVLQHDIDKKIKIVPVCSEKKELIGGRKTEKFGKDEIEEQAYLNFWHSISLRLPDRCENIMYKEIDKWKQTQKQYISEKTGIWNDDDIEDELKIRTKTFTEKLNKLDIVSSEINKTVNMYKFFVNSLGYPPITKGKFKGNIRISFPSSEKSDFSGWDYLLLPFAPILIPIFMFGAKKDNKTKLFNALDKVTKSIKKDVREKMNPKIKEIINSIKVTNNDKT